MWIAEYGMLQQAKLFIEAVHCVEVLHCRTGGAFNHVVERADDNLHAATGFNGNVAEVRTRDILRRRNLARHADKRLVAIVFIEAIQHLIFRHVLLTLHVDRREDSSVHRNDVWREDSFRFGAAESIQDLIDLRHVAMGADAIRGSRFIALGIVKLEIRFATGAGDTGLGIHN